MIDTLDPDARRRLVGAVWFGAWAVCAAGIVFLVPALDGPGVPDDPTLLYFVLLPGLAALPAGALVGPWILDPARAGPGTSVALGLLAAVVAHLVFAPLFALGMSIDGSRGFVGLWTATSALGIPMMGPVTLPAGALAGWTLFLLGRATAPPTTPP